jgi:Ser/Thr protein kinase RdoA (MazF antagonist)
MDFNLPIDILLSAAENAFGKKLTGMTSPLPSYINRVYEFRAVDSTKIIAKFYRPGRWNSQAIHDEHSFLKELQDAEIPVVAPIQLQNGTTVGEIQGVLFALFPKKAGRQLEINSWEDWLRIGMLTSRIHCIGAQRIASSRVRIDPSLSTTQDLEFLRASVLPSRYKDTYSKIVNEIISLSKRLFVNVEPIRIHGDLHRGNILDRMDEGLFIIDLDDMAMGPPVQDLWLLLPDRIDKSRSEAELFIEGYEHFREFDHNSLKCIEPLRAMRMIYFLAWCSKQVDDYQFRKNFPDWGNDSFWQKEINDLKDQMEFIREV